MFFVLANQINLGKKRRLKHDSGKATNAAKGELMLVIKHKFYRAQTKYIDEQRVWKNS